MNEIISTLILIISVLIFSVGAKLYYNFKYESIGKILILIGSIGTLSSMIL
jgi:hypothetical protein